MLLLTQLIAESHDLRVCFLGVGMHVYHRRSEFFVNYLITGHFVFVECG